jgi:hypothetical protein
VKRINNQPILTHLPQTKLLFPQNPTPCPQTHSLTKLRRVTPKTSTLASYLKHPLSIPTHCSPLFTHDQFLRYCSPTINSYAIVHPLSIPTHCSPTINSDALFTHDQFRRIVHPRSIPTHCSPLFTHYQFLRYRSPTINSYAIVHHYSPTINSYANIGRLSCRSNCSQLSHLRAYNQIAKVISLRVVH